MAILMLWASSIATATPFTPTECSSSETAPPLAWQSSMAWRSSASPVMVCSVKRVRVDSRK